MFSEPAWPLDMSAEDRVVRYVCMPGVGFGGTTLLAFLLNAHPECVSIGEATGMIGGIDVANYDCSCGVRFTDCDFWRRVDMRLKELGHPMELYRPNFWKTHFRVSSNRYLDAALIRSLRNDVLTQVRDAVVGRVKVVQRRLEASTHATWALARGVLDVSGKKVFIDSAKDHLRPRLLHQIDSLDVRAIHLVRDARGNTASIMKRRSHLDAASATERWRNTHFEVERVRKYFPTDRWLRVRYDHLCQDPQRTLDRICEFLGVPPAPLPQDFSAAEHHIIGNRMRLAGSRQIREDLSWKELLTESDLRAIARISGPLNRSFGFDWP
jgi:hypothetical protein